MARADGMMARNFDAGAAFGGSGAMAVSPDAMYQLGKKYVLGRDVQTDLVLAHKWFNLAAMQGNTAAKSYRMEISLDMTKAQIASAQKMAREHLSGSTAIVTRPAAVRSYRYG
jgi:uncharacterized protein